MFVSLKFLLDSLIFTKQFIVAPLKTLTQTHKNYPELSPQPF